MARLRSQRGGGRGEATLPAAVEAQTKVAEEQSPLIVVEGLLDALAPLEEVAESELDVESAPIET